MKAGLQHIFILIFLISGNLEFSYAQTYGHRTIGVDQGLPSSEVYSVIQDDDGYIWGATDRGLFCYNGRTTKIYSIEDGLPSNTVYKLFKDPLGRIWMASSDNRIAYYQNGKITIIPASNHWLDEIYEGRNIVIGIAMDAKGDIWLSVLSGGEIHVFAEGGFRKYEFLKQRSTTILLHPMTGSSVLPSLNYSGDSWYEYAKKNRLATVGWSHGTKVFSKEHPIVFSVDYHIYTVKGIKDQIHFSVDKKLITVNTKGELREKEYPQRIIGMGRDRKGGLWISCLNHGLYYYASGDLNSEALFLWSGESISDVEVDYEGGMWFSSIKSGLHYVPNLYHLQYVNGELDEEITVFGVVDNEIYGSTFSNYVFKIDDKGIVTGTHWESSSTQQYGIVEKAGNEILFSGYLFATMNKQLEKQHVFEKWNGIFRAVDFCVRDNLYYIASHVHLIVCSKEKVLEFKTVKQDPTSLELLSDDRIWLGTREGLYEVGEDNTLRRLFPEVKGLGGHITDIQQNADGTIAISTFYHGIFILKGKTWTQISEAEGLPSSLCKTLRFRGATELWVGSNRGLSKIEWKNDRKGGYRITNFTKEQGLSSNEVAFVGLTKDKVWVGTRNGITSLDLGKDLLNLTPPKFKLHKMLLNGEEKRYHRKMLFQPDENNLIFHFDVFSYRNPEGNYIRYRIQNQSEPFIDVEGSVLSLSNLEKGTYVIEVYGVNNDQTISSTPILLSFEILPHYYETWWFRTLLAFVAIVLIYLLMRWRFMVQRRKDLERLRLERQLSSSQLTAIRSQMNPHFIFNAFNGIQRYVLQKDKMDTYRYVNKFSTLIREVLEQSAQNYIPLEKEVDMLRNYVEIESLRFDNKFSFKLEVDVPESLMEYEIPAMIVQPFVENAIWHGLMPLDDRPGELTLRFTVKNHNLVIEVIDNGIGREESEKIKKKAKASSMGLRMIEERIQLVNTLQPNEPVSSWIEDLKDENGKACGTRVNISMKIIQEE